VKQLLARGFRFYAVGAIGIGVQLAALWLLRGRLGLHYLVATALAVEIALLHNYLWHERWTWADRPASVRERLGRVIRFHASNGVLSLIGNVALMRVLAGAFGMHYMAANVASIAAVAIANFLASEYFVFRHEG
jgi:putative flippase GtrA